MTEHVPAAMTVVPGIEALETDHGRLFVVVGVFDGIHRGHRYLLQHLREAAAVRNARPAVITFDHHPDEIITGAAPPLLCDPGDRLTLLAEFGVAVTVVQHFDVALRMTGYAEFIGRIAARVDLAGFLMTPDSAFGHERRGTPEAVAAAGYAGAFDVAVIPPFDLHGRAVRSSEIRTAIATGNLADAALLLGRPYSVVGERPSGSSAVSTLRFAMPVALPPAGEYPVHISHDGAAESSAVGLIDENGAVSIRADSTASPGRLRVTFARSR